MNRSEVIIVTSYKAEQIKKRLLEFCTLMEFEYNGLECHIDPFNPTLFHIYCNGAEKDVHSIDDVMSAPLFGGKCLNDIADQIQILDW